MSYCPKDGSPCADDLCYGSGCMEMNGYPMLEKCSVCGCMIDEELDISCSCDEEDDGIM